MVRRCSPDTYGRIEEPSTDAEEDPCVDKQRETKSQRDVKKRRRARRAVNAIIGRRVGNLSSGKCKGQEQGSADEFT
jgi:hypothetical protein